MMMTSTVAEESLARDTKTDRKTDRQRQTERQTDKDRQKDRQRQTDFGLVFLKNK